MTWWLFIPFIIIVFIICIAFQRISNQSYRFGEGLFKSSEFDLDEKEEFSDKEYYHEDGLRK